MEQIKLKRKAMEYSNDDTTELKKNLAHHLKYTPDAFGTVRAVGIDKYPGEMTILRELVQNADDAIDRKNKVFPTYIKFILKNDEIIVEHDGKPFSKPPDHLLEKSELNENELEELNSYDFKKISNIGLGKTDEELTGKFGTGFTSVFHITDNPRIESNGWDFEIRIGKEPVVKEIPQNKLTFIHLPFRLEKTETASKISAEVVDEVKKKHFEERVLVESYKIIFFLKHIRKIEVYKDEEPLYTVQKIERDKKSEIKNLSCKNVTISIQNLQDKNWKDPKEKWWIYSLENLSIPVDLREVGLKLKQKVSMAISNGKQNFAEEHKIPSYSYFTFPIKEIKFHFKYNASKFFTTTERSNFITREGLKNDWNKWQINNLVQLLIKIVSEFTTTKKRPDILYNILPQPHEYIHEYDKYLIDKFRENILHENIKIFYTTRGNWVGPKKVFIADERLETFLPKSKYPNFVNHQFIKSYRNVLEFYGAKSISHKELIDYLEEKHETEHFKRRFKTKSDKEKIEKLILIYEYLFDSKLAKEDIEKLKTLDFVLTEDGALRSAGYRVYFPSERGMPPIHPDDIVHHSVYETKKSRKFLKDYLKIEKMKLHDLIVDCFLRRLNQFNEKQKLEFVLYLARMKKEVMKQKEAMNKLKSKLREILKFKINVKEDTNIYFNEKELKQIFGDKLNYLSRKYGQELSKLNIKWKVFFKALGILEVPNHEIIIEIASDISENDFSIQSAVRANRLFRFISKNFRRFNKEKLEELNSYKWIPTTNSYFELPEKTYVDKKFVYLLGTNSSFISFPVKKDNPLAKLLKMSSEPHVEDVISHLLDHNTDIDTTKARGVDFRIYEYLNSKVQQINRELINKLANNKTIWFRGKLWYPKDVFLKNCSKEFGPNGKIRGYIYKSKLKNLTEFCSILNIKDKPEEVSDYVDFLIDISEQEEQIEAYEWKNYIENAHTQIAYSNYPLSEPQKEALKKSKIIVFSSYLIYPNECFLIRGTDKIFFDKITMSGIANVPFILENDPKKERFYLFVGVKEIYTFVFQKRIDESTSEAYEEWNERFDNLAPWINGYAYHSSGSEGLMNLDFLASIEVQKISELNVVYSLDYNGEILVGNPIDDFCCLVKDDNGKYVLYLDESFDETNNEHISFVSTLLTTLIPRDIDIKRVEWVMLLNQYFRHGEISGIIPYDIKQIKGAASRAGIKEVSLVGKIEEKERELKVKAKVDAKKEYWVTGREVDAKLNTKEEDGLNSPKITSKQKKKRKRTSVPGPKYRGGGYPTPHAINYEEERNWVRNQANNFCQVCILFCENCKIKDIDGQCPCEIRKNAERAINHHHLEPFGGDLTRDVRGNLTVVCNYHHKQLDGINFKQGYLNDKVIMEERENDVILTVYPKDKDESELKIKFTEEHFYEFQKYMEKET